jgi:uncharacterized protein (TIGR00255 family)
VLHYLGFDGLLCQRLLAILALGESGVYVPADAESFLTRLHSLERMAREASPGRCSAELYALLLALSEGLTRLPGSHVREGESLEKEMILYLEKLDINEEKVRLRQHCKYFLDTIENEPYPGKKLGFIIQEMGREINTTGSKANHAGIQRLVVRMKDELEKIREQSMNIL